MAKMSEKDRFIRDLLERGYQRVLNCSLSPYDIKELFRNQFPDQQFNICWIYNGYQRNVTHHVAVSNRTVWYDFNEIKSRNDGIYRDVYIHSDFSDVLLLLKLTS